MVGKYLGVCITIDSNAEEQVVMTVTEHTWLMIVTRKVKPGHGAINYPWVEAETKRGKRRQQAVSCWDMYRG